MGLGTTLKISFDSKKVQRGLDSITSKIGAIGKKFATFGLAAITTGFAAITAGLVAFTVGASKAATSIESLTTQFKTLLGSSSAAQERMEEITKFAAETPFEISELADTSKLLQTLGGNLLATGDGLRLVGDAAAMSGQPIKEVGLSIGRIFNAITSGTSAGEAVNRLQELGLITGKTKLGFETLAAAQKKGVAASLTSAEALKRLKTVMSQTEGGMAALAATTEGKLSNMADNISQLKVAFGTGFNDGLRVALDAINTKLPEMLERFKVFGDSIGQTISDAVNGNFQKLVDVGKLIGDVISAAAVAAFQAGSGGIIAPIENFLRQKGRETIAGVGNDPNSARRLLPDIQGQSFQDLFDAAMINRGVQQQFQKVTGTSPEPYKPSSESPSFRDAQLSVLSRTMERNAKASEETARNTREGGKF